MESATEATPRTIILGTFAFLVFWVSATFPKFVALPVGRTGGAIVAATLMVVFQVVSPDEAYASINLPILGLLFGTMVVSVYLQRANMFQYVSSALTYRCRGGRDLICRLSFLVAFTSALFTNDTSCVLLTEFILSLCKEKGLPPEPFLLALATSANLGSSTTPIGNPQNLVIAIQSKISFGKFLVGIIPAMVVGVTLNLCLLLALYWNELSSMNIQHKSTPKSIDLPTAAKVIMQDPQPIPNLENREDQSMAVVGKPEASKGCNGFRETSFVGPTEVNDIMEHHSGKIVPESIAQTLRNNNCEEHAEGSLGQECPHVVCVVDEPQKDVQQATGVAFAINTSFFKSPCSFSLTYNKNKAKVWKVRFWRLCIYLVTLGMLAALLAGLDLSWCTITAAIALIVLDFEDAGPSLGKVSYSLLVFFSGMFITMDGFDQTTIPAKFWDAVEPHARINHASGMAILTAIIILLSNITSNVPTVLLLGPKIVASSAAIPGASVARTWLLLAWASTVAGNLTLVGSAANLIVCEKARTAKTMPYNLSFWRHLKFGFPSTLIIVAAGIPLIKG